MILVGVAPGGPRLAQKIITFTGASTLGLHGTATTVFTVSGLVLVQFIGGRATTSLTGASATLTLGTTNKTTVFIGTTTATTLTTSAELWASTTATQGAIALPATMTNTILDENIICSSTHVSADVTAGVLEIDCLWWPLTPSATLV